MLTYDRIWRKANSNPTEFNTWISLLDVAEKLNDIDKSRRAFDAFFTHFPYCYGYWKKYADLERHAGNKDASLEVYQRGVDAIPLSIDLWTAYLDAMMEICHGQPDYEVKMRNLYELALEKAGMEFRSDALWEHYISWEAGHNRLSNVLRIYDRILKTPTQLYYQNWDSFKKLIEDNKPEDVLSESEFSDLLARVSPVAGAALRIASCIGFPDDNSGDYEPPILETKKPAIAVSEADRNAIRQLVTESREKIYQMTYIQIMKRWYFEEKIRRPYFHVKPLEEAQLYNWSEYLSFEESECANLLAKFKSEWPDRDPLADPAVVLARKRVRILYERCLLACALYENMWIRYAKYLEYTEVDVPAAREVWRRACSVHLKVKPTIHWHWALFEERNPANCDKFLPTLTPSPVSGSTPSLGNITALEILSALERQLPDSVLVCARKIDAMRRSGQPVLDLIVCTRSAINRLRLRASEQASLAYSLTGPSASMSAAMALATSAQARAGAGYLACKLARILHRNPDNLLPPSGLPQWQLLLSSAFKAEATPALNNHPTTPAIQPHGDTAMQVGDDADDDGTVETAFESTPLPEKEPLQLLEAQKSEEKEPLQLLEEQTSEEKEPLQLFEEQTSEEKEPSHLVEDQKSEEKEPLQLLEDQKSEEKEPLQLLEDQKSEDTEPLKLPEEVKSEEEEALKIPEEEAVNLPEEEEDEVQMEEAVTPEHLAQESESMLDAEMMETADSPPVVCVKLSKSTRRQSGAASAGEPEPEQQKRKRKTRWGSEADLERVAKEEEEERQALAEEDAIAYAETREQIITVRPPSPSELTEGDLQLLTPEQAAIAVLKEAIAYDPRNERLFAQMLDIAYQRRPIDLQGFLEFVDFALVESLLPVTIKLAFSQRKLQFLEEFDTDTNRLSTAYDEYVDLCNLVCRNTNNRQTGVDAAQAYTIPDLLNVVLPTPLRPSARQNPAPNGPVRKQARLRTDQAIYEDAASVGTPVPPAQNAVTCFTAGAYEPLAAAQGLTSGLPPPAPTMVPVAPPIGLTDLNSVSAIATSAVSMDASEMWPATTSAGALATGVGNSALDPYSGFYYAPLSSLTSASADFTLPAPPPPPPFSLSNST